jgi:glycosyltransferase involved in cell wall biosynthesis
MRGDKRLVDKGNPRPLRVLVICYEYPPVGGGGGRIAALVAQRLAGRGHRLRVLTAGLSPLPKEETIGGVSVRRAFSGRRRPDLCTVPEMAIYAAAHAASVLVELKRFGPDVVHVHFGVPSGAVAWWGTRFVRVPYVLTAHLGDVPGGAPEQTDRLFQFLQPFTVPIWRGAAAVTAVSASVAVLVKRAYRLHARVINNGIDMQRRLSPTPEVRAGPLRLVWCGRMQEQKNLGPAIEGLAPLRGRDWNLDVIGDGPLRADIEARCGRVGLTGHVRFRGWREGADVQDALSDADALFLPSLSEGSPVVALEAMRAGLAFVASRIDSMADLIDDGENGLLCDPKRPESFATALATLLDDRARLAAMRASSLARAPRFDAERMVDDYESVLRAAALSGSQP